MGRKRSSGSAENRLLGARVELARRKAGISRRDLADRLGLHVSMVGRIEAGTVALSFVRGAALADALGVELNDLCADVAPVAEATE